MSEATERLGAGRASEKSASYTRVVAVLSAAHFISHYYILILAPLLPFVRAEYGVSYTQIGMALAAFNIVSALLQTPAGFLVDRLGARVLLIVGVAVGASAFVIAGLIDSFWVMVAMFALAGVGNTVYHPADYALLSHHVPAERIGQAFSIHTFAGMLGSAVAPASLLMMQSVWGWRGAFIGAGILGFAVAAVLLAVPRKRRCPGMRRRRAPLHDKSPDGWRLLMSPPILLNLVVLCLARDDERRHVQLFGGRAECAVRNASDGRQCGFIRTSAVGVDRRADRRSAGRAHLATRAGGGARAWRHRACSRCCSPMSISGSCR